MIKYMATNESNGRIILGLIIVKDNIENLKNDKPIHINAEEMRLKEFKFNEIVISYCETEEDAIKLFQKHGLIDKQTKVYEDRNPTKQ